MVYPVLKINQVNSNSYQINIVDTDFDAEPILTMDCDSSEEGIGSLYTMLTAFINQYNYGYGQGYDDACEDMELDE